MEAYEKLATNRLIALYSEILKNIEKGFLSNNMYYELGVIIQAASLRGKSLNKPSGYNQVVDSQVLADYIYYTCKWFETDSATLIF